MAIGFPAMVEVAKFELAQQGLLEELRSYLVRGQVSTGENRGSWSEHVWMLMLMSCVMAPWCEHQTPWKRGRNPGTRLWERQAQ